MGAKELWANRTELVEAMAAAAKDGNNEEALRLEGEVRALDVRISEALAEDEVLRAAGLENQIAPAEASFAEQLFGPQASFAGIEAGFKKSVSLQAAASNLPTPQIYHRELPGPVAPPTGFLSTLLHGTTEGDEHFFITPVLDNKAAGWTSGVKPESSLEWTEGSAPLETIAHWIPILKQVARRYKQLESITSGALMMGLDLVADAKSLRGNNKNGITGVLNTSGILVHDKVADKNLKDTFATMRRKVRVATGIAPNYVALSPYALEELSQTKDKEGRYLFPDIGNGGTIAGMTAVEDVNMTSEAGKEEALVYYSGGASFDVADPAEVTVGLQNSQFVENAYTLLGETTAALRVDMPAGFCHCPDLGLAVEA